MGVGVSLERSGDINCVSRWTKMEKDSDIGRKGKGYFGSSPVLMRRIKYTRVGREGGLTFQVYSFLN